MARAYLKIFIDPHAEETILEDLLKIPEVKLADLTVGEQDVIAVLESDSFDDIVQVVLGQIRNIPGISRTITNLSISYK